MTGINQLAALLVNAIKRAQKKEKKKSQGNQVTSASNLTGSNKPRAKWITTEEQVTLKAAGKCFRCKKKGHIGAHCPDFRPARPPGSHINAMWTRTKELSSSEEDLESCSLDSNFESEKE